MKVQQVVGVAFIEDNKLLIAQSVKSSKTNSYTFIGGGVEEGETLEEAAVREVGEEIHNGFTISPKDLELVLTFQEHAASDPNKMIEMHIFVAKKKIDVSLTPNEEIIHYHWYTPYEEGYHVSSSIYDHFLPYAIEKGLLHMKEKSK